MAMFNSYVSLPEGTHIYPLFVSDSYGKWMKMSHLQMIFPAIKLHLEWIFHSYVKLPDDICFQSMVRWAANYIEFTR